MHCPACGKPNHPGRIYCGACARRLVEPCPACQFMNAPEDRYCGGCAGDLRVATAPRAAAPDSRCAIPLPLPRSAPAPASIFTGLEDLTAAPAPAAGEGDSRARAADLTQDEIDAFFHRLVREGVAQIRPPAPLDRATNTPGKDAP